MDSLKNISQFNTGSTIANGMALSETAVASYKAAIDGLSLSQAQAALSSTALTDAQKEQVLVSAGLLQSTEAITLEEVKQLASSASLSAQKKEEILTTLQGAYAEGEWNIQSLEAIKAKGGEAGAIAESILAKKTENAENVKGVASSKALTASLWEQLKARLALLAANPVAWIAGAIALGAGLVAIQKKLTKSLEECTEELDKNNSAFDEAQSEAESLQSEWKTCQKRLDELKKLAASGTISIIEQEEYERLQKTNDELERNIKIQQEKAQLSAIDAANSADETLNKTVESKYVTVDTQDSQGVEITQTAWITPKEELNASIEEYKRLQTEIDRLKVSYDNGSISAEDYNTQLTDLTNQQTDARNRASEMSDILVESEQAYTNLTNTGAELTTTQTANYNSVRQANEAYNDFLGTINGIDAAFENLDTTEKAQSLKNKYAAKKVSLPKGQGSYTVEDKEISDWIDTLSDEDLTVLASINFSGEQTKESMEEALDYAKNNVDGNVDETSILSFSDAWEQLKNSTEDATKGLADDLIELAEAGKLTAEALTEADTSEFFKNAGISAEEATRQINALVSSSTQLQSMSAQISKMSDMLADKKNGTVASASDLAGFDATVKGLESWDEFERVMGSSKSSMEECQAAANALATEWVNNGNYLANLTDENKDYYITQLNNMGIENADAIVTNYLTQKKQALALATEFATAKGKDLSNATFEEINAFIEENKIAGEARNALYRLALAKQGVNAATLSFDGDITNIKNYVKALGGAAYALSMMEQIKNNPSASIPSEARNQILKQAQIEVETVTNTPADVGLSDLGSFGYKPSGGSGGSGSGSGSDTKQTIDWIERKISSLNDNIDLTQSKIDNLFNIKTPKGLSKQITDVSNKLKKASDNTDKWKSKLSKIKIPDSVKKLIQGGKDVNLSKYSKTEQKNIKKYQSTWKSYSSAKKKENSLYNQKWDLQTQKGKEALLKSQEKDYNTLAKIEEKAYKKYMSKAKSVKLSSSLKKKVQSGDYNINDYSSKQQELIQEYQNWYDKAQESLIGKQEAKKNARDKRIERYQSYVDNAESKIAKSQALAALDEGNYKKQNKHLEGQKKYYKESYEAQIKIAEEEKDAFKVTQLRAELAQQLRDIEKEEFDNVVSTYEYKIGHIKNQLDDLTNAISDVENRGLIADSTFYTAQIDVQNKIKDQLETEHQKLKEQLKDIKDFTPAWYNALNSIQDVENEIANTNSAIKELQNSINGVANTLSGNILDSFRDLNDEADTLITLLGDNLSDDKLGKLTSEGIAALGLYNQQMNVSKASVERVQNEINSIQKAIDNGTYGNFVDSNGMLRTFASTYEAEDRIKELYSTYRSEIQSTYQYESKIVDLMKQKYQSELNYVKELIDQKKEQLSAEQDLYQYSRDIKTQVDGINSIKKQLSALSGDNSLENQSKIQKLNKQLKDAQNDMENEQVNRVLEQQEKMLDTLSKEYQQLIESVSKDRDTLLKEGNQLISANGAEIQQTINETASEYGMQLTDNMQSATANITTGLSGIKTVLDTIAQHVAGRIVDTDGEIHDVNAGGAKNDAISKLLSSGTNTSPNSKLTKAISEAYGVGLNLQQIADLSRLLGLNYELKDFTNESPIHNQAKLDILKELEDRGYLKKSGNSYIRGYAGGGVISSVANAIRLNGDKVLISGKPGERMLTEKQNENFEKFTDALPDLVNLTDIIKPNVNVPTAIDRNIGGITYGGNNQINIELPNVTNYEDFMRKFQNDPKAEQLVQHMTASALNGSRLGKNTIRF